MMKIRHIHSVVAAGLLLLLGLTGPAWAADGGEASLEGIISQAINTSGFGGRYTLRIHSRPTDGQIGTNRELTAFSIDKTTGQFRATVRATDDTGARRDLTLVGKAERQASLPVLVAEFREGEIITADDIRWLPVSANRASVGYVQKAEDLIGMTVRRTKRADDPIRTTDIRAPWAVRKGDMVTMQIRHGALALSTMGRALNNAALGEVVRVQNTESLQTVEGRAAGLGVVSVAMRTTVILADR